MTQLNHSPRQRSLRQGLGGFATSGFILHAVLAGALWPISTPPAQAQVRPYIGFVYPAGGQQGTTLQIKLGGEGLEGVDGVLITGSGARGKVVEYRRPLGVQEVNLLNEQLKELQRQAERTASTLTDSGLPMMEAESAMRGSGQSVSAVAAKDEATKELIDKIQRRTAEWVIRPASAALAGIVFAEVTIAADAQPGERELRLLTRRGISNPLVFHVGQLPERSRKPMLTAPVQVLGKEELALRNRPADEVEVRIKIPVTLNGQIASGERNRYRFTARKGQRLVITTQARQLIPFIADAVPGWFQPVLTLSDANGTELAYDEDYRFKPDPVILYQVVEDGDYVMEIRDALYRGREDFVYRLTIGETPFLTSLFPLGACAGTGGTVRLLGWNLGVSELAVPVMDNLPGIYRVAVTNAGFVSNPLPFALDTLPECFEREPNNTRDHAQKVTLPIIVNGRIDQPDDWDVFSFAGRSNDVVVAEVCARRLDSPLDSVLKLTDSAGRLIAFNDDHEDLAAGANTHDADSWLMTRLPADGTYFVQVGDTARHGGAEYGYRLRISEPRPDFELRVVPSSLSFRGKGAATATVYAIRKDGFTGPIELHLNLPPAGFSAAPVFLESTQAMTKLTVKTTLRATEEPLNLTVSGTGFIQGREVVHEALPAEDRMQAFLWRHLVPAAELKALVFDPSDQPPGKRRPHPVPPAKNTTNAAPAVADSAKAKPKFTKQQVAGRLRELERLFDEGLLTDLFFAQKVAECEAVR